MHMAPGSAPPALGFGSRAIILLALGFLCACQPAGKSEAELRQEIQGLKAQLTAVQEKLGQVQAGQQTILDLLKQPTPVATPLPSQPPAPEILTVAQLLAGKDRYLGLRVRVKGAAGPVMVHHKSLMLKAPQGMVEVLFGNLPDAKLVQSLSSTTLDKPLTVTGVVNLAPGRGAGAALQINAEAVEY